MYVTTEFANVKDRACACDSLRSHVDTITGILYGRDSANSTDSRNEGGRRRARRLQRVVVQEVFERGHRREVPAVGAGQGDVLPPQRREVAEVLLGDLLAPPP